MTNLIFENVPDKALLIETLLRLLRLYALQNPEDLSDGGSGQGTIAPLESRHEETAQRQILTRFGAISVPGYVEVHGRECWVVLRTQTVHVPFKAVTQTYNTFHNSCPRYVQRKHLQLRRQRDRRIFKCRRPRNATSFHTCFICWHIQAFRHFRKNNLQCEVCGAAVVMLVLFFCQNPTVPH